MTADYKPQLKQYCLPKHSKQHGY